MVVRPAPRWSPDPVSYGASARAVEFVRDQHPDRVLGQKAPESAAGKSLSEPGRSARSPPAEEVISSLSALLALVDSCEEPAQFCRSADGIQFGRDDLAADHVEPLVIIAEKPYYV